MGSPNSLNLVDVALGQAVIGLDPYQIIELWFRLLSSLKPYLEYFHGFRPLEDYFRQWLGGASNRVVEIAPVFPDGITGRTRIVSVAEISKATIGRTRRRVTLHLSDKGELILIDGTYELVPNRTTNGLTGDNEVARELQVRILGRDDLRKQVQACGDSSWPQPVDAYILGLLDQLRSLSLRTVEERQDRLRKVQDVHDCLNRVLRRIGR